MNYFLKITSKPNYPLVYDAQHNNTNGSYFAVGKYINEKISDPLIYNDAQNSDIGYEKLITYSALETVGGGVLYSRQFVDFLYKNGFDKDVQIFDARFNYKGNSCDNYYVVNIYNKIECYDMDQSVYQVHPVDKTYKFSKAVLKEEPLEEYGYIYNIARSVYDNKIIVSGEFRELLKTEKMNSISFSTK